MITKTPVRWCLFQTCSTTNTQRRPIGRSTRDSIGYFVSLSYALSRSHALSPSLSLSLIPNHPNLISFTITAQREFKKGDQVFDSYGRKCNTEFFMNYGFVPEEPNPNNECKLILSFPEDTDLYAYKMLLLPSDLHQVQVSRDYVTEECAEMWSQPRPITSITPINQIILITLRSPRSL